MALRQFSASYGPCIWCGTVVVKKYLQLARSSDKSIKTIKMKTLNCVIICKHTHKYICVLTCILTLFVIIEREREVLMLLCEMMWKLDF